MNCVLRVRKERIQGWLLAFWPSKPDKWWCNRVMAGPRRERLCAGRCNIASRVPRDMLDVRDIYVELSIGQTLRELERY